MNDRDYSTRLESDVKKWVMEGIIDAKAAAAIPSRYPSEPDTRRSRTGGMIALLGALLITVASVGYGLRFGKSTLKVTGSALCGRWPVIAAKV